LLVYGTKVYLSQKKALKKNFFFFIFKKKKKKKKKKKRRRRRRRRSEMQRVAKPPHGVVWSPKSIVGVARWPPQPTRQGGVSFFFGFNMFYCLKL
jgi:hypothetical protein